MSFSDGSPSAANTSITIKSLDDFQNFNQFEAFLEAVDNGLHFSDGTATVEVAYVSGRHETLLIYKELFFAPVARGIALQKENDDTLRIVVQSRNTSSPSITPASASSFSVLKEYDYRNSNKKTLAVSEVHPTIYASRGRFMTNPRPAPSPGPGAPIKRVEMVRSIDYAPYEGYVSSLEDRILDIRQADPTDVFVAFLQNLTENPRDHESMPYYLPPVIDAKVTSGDVTPPPPLSCHRVF
ncbi:hypothetical protein SAMN05192551_10340 [Tindallia magadiensis]|uniref:Uncharacterized protein n=2 Tax=Tindallia magadiensis TaxID=69895 RepID=A0A1I3CW28_9FIRM|nr:hypothetical protein SAMN05192551_10340 [Tindallia magadiensis]